jgi:uncharacterized protein
MVATKAAVTSEGALRGSVAGRPMKTFRGKYLSLTSFRRDGTGVASPMWFVEEGGRLLVNTDGSSYKVRRILRDPHVMVAVCTARGRLLMPQVPARAEVLPSDEVGRVDRLIAQKYRIDLVFLRPIRALQRAFGRRQGDEVILGITPEPTEPIGSVR